MAADDEAEAAGGPGDAPTPRGPSPRNTGRPRPDRPATERRPPVTTAAVRPTCPRSTRTT